jgi:hypothetical protein
MSALNGRSEQERGLDALRKWAIAGIVVAMVGVVLLRFAAERVVE